MIAIVITFDTQKRAWTLQERGLDFKDAALVFDGAVFVFEEGQ